MADINYSNIERPYNSLMQRSGEALSVGESSSQDASSSTYSSTNTPSASISKSIATGVNGSVETQPVKADGAMGDVWINNFIRSQNWKPKTVGFYIDGQTGYAEFTNVYVSGNIQALTGQIGGWLINTTSIYDIAGMTGMSSTVTGGDDIRFWAGNVTPGSAPFRVTESGALVASSATITGAITATSGSIGGWVVTASDIKDVAGTVGMSSAVTGGDDIRFFAGNVTPASAPFRVTEAGVLTATSGAIGSWTLGSTTITGTGVTLSNGLADAYISFGITPPSVATVGTGIFIDKTGLYGLNANTQNFKIDATNGNITAIAGTVGGCVLATTSIGSTTFVSGPLGSGWNINNTGTAEFQNVTIRGTIRTSVFEKDTISAVNGMVLISKADVLSADMTALDSSTLVISGQTSFVANEVIRIKDGTDDEWMLITNAASAPTYTVTRDTAGSYAPNTNPIWKKGTAVASMGVGTGTKTGYVLLDSTSANSPFIDIYGRNSNTYTDTTLHGRFGWLKGITDSDVGLATTDVWGLYTDNAYIKGVVVANTGYIGGNTGWVITSNYIKDVAGVTGMSSVVTGGDDIRFWAGHATPGSAPFRVTESGALVASSATITGAITATSGAIGGWVVTASDLKDAAGVVGISSTVTAGDDIRFFAGNATPASAPFRVTESGALVASSATITGAITATSGTFAGITSASIDVGTTGKIYGGQSTYNTGTGFFLGYDTSAYKLSLGTSSNGITWDGTSLNINGGTLTSGLIQTGTTGNRVVFNYTNNSIGVNNGFVSLDANNNEVGIQFPTGQLLFTNFSSSGVNSYGYYGRHINTNLANGNSLSEIWSSGTITNGSQYQHNSTVLSLRDSFPLVFGNLTKTGTGTINAIRRFYPTTSNSVSGVSGSDSDVLHTKYDFWGTNASLSTKSYKIEIDGTGTPNTFRWSENGGVVWKETGVAIDASGNILTIGDGNSVAFKFSATTGGVMGDYWTGTGGSYSTDNSIILNITQYKNTNTVAPLKVYNETYYSTYFNKIATFQTVTLWTGNGASPNGSLTGTAGDVCFGCDSGKAYYCGGGTTWTAM